MTTKDIENFKDDVIEILKSWSKGSGFRARKLTDTPTDALQVVNKKYISSLFPITIAQGGTGQTTKAAAFDALAPSAAKGDLIANTGGTNSALTVGSNEQFLVADSTQSTGLKYISLVQKNGTTTRAGNTASGTQNIAHGLGVIPRHIKLTAYKILGAVVGDSAQCIGVYNGTTTSAIWYSLNRTVGTDAGTDTTNIIYIEDAASGTDNQAATVTFNATNIVLSWTKTGSPEGTNIFILWEAYS